MSPKQLVLSGKQLITILQKMGFEMVRIKGSHHRMKHEDGRITTVPVHKNEDIAKGLLRKIVREDLKVEMDEFENFVSNNR